MNEFTRKRQSNLRVAEHGNYAYKSDFLDDNLLFLIFLALATILFMNLYFIERRKI